MLGRSDARPHRSLLLGTVVLSVLLAGLAALQYRWLGQIGEADAARLRTSARTRAAQFARELDHEISLAFLWLPVGPVLVGSADPRNYAERFSGWSSRTRHPGIVRAVYVVDEDRLRRFDPHTGAFVNEEWPAELEIPRQRLQGRERQPAGAPRETWRGYGPIDPELPGLLMPILQFDRTGPGGGVPERPRFPVSFTLIHFDERYLREQLLPSLARRHFAVDGELEYDVRVDRRVDPPSVVFASHPDIPADGPFDAVVSLFGVRLEDAQESDLSGLPWPAPGGLRRPSGPMFFGARLARPGGQPLAAPAVAADSGYWRLGARYHTGSVDAVVEKARRRNLAASGGILGLLLATAALIVVSAQRARRLADRQIDFVAGVSHELRTPLAALRVAGDNLAAGIVTDTATAQEYGRMVRSEGRRLAEMVERVLDLAGSYSGHQRLRLEDLDVAALAAESLASVQLLAAERGLRLESDLPSSLPRVRGDRSALTRALTNLLQNAILHGADGGLVKLFARPGAERNVHVTVQDAGRGIPSAEVAQLFEPFFRGAEAVARQTPGAGLGLSLVKQLLEAQHGEVRVTTAPGRGSAFTLVLPTSREEPR